MDATSKVEPIGFNADEYGCKPVGQIRGYGFYNLLAGILFGAGIFLSGGCILGILRQIGEGNVTSLLVFISLIPGMALVVYGLDPLLQSNYNIQRILLPDVLGIPAPWVTGLLVIGAIAWFQRIRYKT